MAVKYSKVRDFGAKGRKTRKLGNKMFTLSSTTKYKKIAKAKASLIRKSGKLARVVKITRGGKTMYGVYKHGSYTKNAKRYVSKKVCR